MTRNVRDVGPSVGRGRPRDERIDRAVLTAAGELISELGPSGLRHELVARRGGVSKATVYRRYPTTRALARALLEDASSTVALLRDAAPSTARGPTSTELMAALDAIIRQLDGTALGALLRVLIGEATRDPSIGELVRSGIVSPWESLIQTILERGLASGELASGTDVGLVAEQVLGVLLFRFALGLELDRRLAARLVRDAIAGHIARRANKDWVALL